MPCGSTMSAAGRYRAPPWPTPMLCAPARCSAICSPPWFARRSAACAAPSARPPIDSTGVRVSGLAAEWARFSAKAWGAKVHVIYDPDTDRPLYAAVTAAKLGNITAAQAMPIEAGATYVFDLGYYDYGWWAKMDAAGCRIVTRFKANTPLTVMAERDVPKDGNILSDRIGLLPQRQAAKTPSVIPFAKCG